MNHYVYKITELDTKKFYIGVRTCDVNPKDDDYMGSYKVWNPSGNLKKEIIKSNFDNRESANRNKKI